MTDGPLLTGLHLGPRLSLRLQASLGGWGDGHATGGLLCGQARGDGQSADRSTVHQAICNMQHATACFPVSAALNPGACFALCSCPCRATLPPTACPLTSGQLPTCTRSSSGRQAGSAGSGPGSAGSRRRCCCRHSNRRCFRVQASNCYSGRRRRSMACGGGSGAAPPPLEATR